MKDDSSSKKPLTPMEEQYFQLKSENSDCILLFRMGDFYEGFDDDAVIMSKVLNITLTSRSKGENKRPMAGVPWHALKDYLSKLVQAGYKVAIAEQLEDPSQTKTLVKRGVTKIITPGTIDEIESLGVDKHNFVLCIATQSNKGRIQFGISYIDILTGDFFVSELIESSSNFPKELTELILRISPSEIIVLSLDNINIDLAINIKKKFGIYTQDFELRNKDISELISKLQAKFNVKTLKGFGIKDDEIMTKVSAGYLLSYLQESLHDELNHISRIKKEERPGRIKLDQTTIRNLEIFYRPTSNSTEWTLFSVLDRLSTPMGKRLLRERLLYPYKDKSQINLELSRVESFFNESQIMEETIKLLKNMNDLSRLAGKIGNRTINPKQVVALKDSLEVVPKIYSSVKGLDSLANLLAENHLDQLSKLSDKIEQSILDEPQTYTNQGGIFREEYSPKISELRGITKNSRQILAEMQKREIENTGISTLKIKFNKVFGYYIEVSKGQISRVPENYERKQTLVNAERFITDELKELENKILTAEDELIKIEQEEYTKFIEEVSEYIPVIQDTAVYLSKIDLYSGFALLAKENNYSKPNIVSDKEEVEIVNGRHPVVSTRIGRDFIPNNYHSDSKSKIMIITGPNMSGKSTYIRQIALIQLLMQIGSFVPAEKANLSIADNIFTRIGANDDLSSGESTFMVEMIEAANILNSATESSLIILDEIGRGTSTYDGVAIAWSIIEYLHEYIGAKVLFATHYHELIKMEELYDNIKNYNVAVDESGKDVMFLYKIEKGGTDKSYGIHVAKMAGVPSEVTERANEILLKLQTEGMFEVRKQTISKYTRRKVKANAKSQEKLF